MQELKQDLLKIADFLSSVTVVDEPGDDDTFHEGIHQWYRSRIAECLSLGMTDVALAYHAFIGKDQRLSQKEITFLLLDTMKLFHGEDEEEDD